MMPKQDAVVVIFSKEQVRKTKTAHFLKTYGADSLPQGPELAAMMGSFQFLVEGWHGSPEEIYAIPEIRKFYQHLHQVWPYWFYFCDLDSETLMIMTLCLLPSFSGYKRLGAPQAAVEYDQMELLQFIQKNFDPLNAMMERAGMSEMEIYNRTRDIFLHYRLPFDSPPPEE